MQYRLYQKLNGFLLQFKEENEEHWTNGNFYDDEKEAMNVLKNLMSNEKL